jgi:hypothetical protein
VRRLGGQAARGLWAVSRVLLALGLGFLVVTGCGFAVLAWQLAEHPIEMPWLAVRLQAAATEAAAPARFRIGAATLAWEGFRAGLGAPIDIRLADVTVSDPMRRLRVEAPRVRLVLELAPLFRGRLRPRSLAILDPRITLTADARLATAAKADEAGWQAALPRFGRRVILRNAQISAPGQRWDVTRLDAELTHQGGGQAEASAEVAATLAGTAVTASLRAAQAASGTVRLHATLGPVRPTALASFWPEASDVAARLDAPATGEADMTLSASLTPVSLRVDLQTESGTVRMGDAPVSLSAGHLTGSWQTGEAARADADFELRPRAGQPGAHLAVHGTARLGRDAATGQVALDLDRLALDDLAALWPAGLARGARTWVLDNVTAGVAHDGHALLGFAVPARPSGPSDVHVTSASGRLAGSDLTVHWLRPIPPVTRGTAALELVDADTLRVDLGTGQQVAGRDHAGELSLEGGSVRITGLSHPDQTAEIRVNVAGSVPNALALLNQPRLGLLSRHPLPLKQPRGQVNAKIVVSLPLEAHVNMDQLSVNTTAHLAALRLADVVAGRELDDGDFTLTATGEGLTLSGTALVAAVPARITGALDFRAGPPAQVQQRFAVQGRVEARALAEAGLDATGILTGPADLDAVYTQRRDGASDLDVRAGLRDAELRVAPLGWRKLPGDPATARTRLILDRASRLRRIDLIEADGVGLTVRGHAALDAAGDAALTLDQLVLGGTTARGTARVSEGARRIAASLSGPRLDLSGRFAAPADGGRVSPTGASGGTVGASAGSGTDWVVDARFSHVVLAHGRLASDLNLHAEVSGGIPRALRLSALTGPGRPVTISITPDRSGRLVEAAAADGGTLLRDLGATEGVEAGRMAISGRYLDQQADRPLSGVATLDRFRVRGAPVLAKVLQAVTLYGLVQAVEGPGMTFDHLAAPFRYAEGTLTLDDARAFNASLGLTARGRIDFDTERLSLEGTIVPAYMLNTALGRIPLIGRLFSPERGGGVIAARYLVRGPLSDPAVRVNPLSALTPGFLRGIFGD